MLLCTEDSATTSKTYPNQVNSWGKIKRFKMSVKKKKIAHTLLQYHCQHIIINRPNQQLLDYTMASKENGARVIYFIRFHSNGRPAHVGLF